MHPVLQIWEHVCKYASLHHTLHVLQILQQSAFPIAWRHSHDSDKFKFQTWKASACWCDQSTEKFDTDSENNLLYKIHSCSTVLARVIPTRVTSSQLCQPLIAVWAWVKHKHLFHPTYNEKLVVWNVLLVLVAVTPNDKDTVMSHSSALFSVLLRKTWSADRKTWRAEPTITCLTLNSKRLSPLICDGPKNANGNASLHKLTPNRCVALRCGRQRTMASACAAGQQKCHCWKNSWKTKASNPLSRHHSTKVILSN